jgi:hypothetical protein
MTFKILLFAYRKSGTTPAQFREHYENKHVPLICSVTGNLFPLTHTRWYIQRSAGKAEGTSRNADFPATVLQGTQADADFDAIAELTFVDEAAFQAFFEFYMNQEAAKELHEDEARFLDRSAVTGMVVGEFLETKKS